MTIRLSTGARNAAVDTPGLGSAFDGGTARFAFYTGALPATGDTAVTGTLLGTTIPASDVFGAASAGTITANAITSDSAADASGTPQTAVLFRTGDTAVTSNASATDRRILFDVGARTQLNGAINNAVTTITVDDTTYFPSTGTLLIDSEQITYSGKTSTTFTGCTRGANSTTAASHSDNAAVYEYGKSCWFDNTALALNGVIAVSSLTLTQPE